MPEKPDKKLLKDAKAALKITRELFKGNSKKLAGEDKEALTAGIAALEDAVRSGGTAGMKEALDRLEKLYELHLSRYRKSTVREYVESIGWAVAVALVLRAFVIEAFKIPSGSMIPTLQIGDHIFVNKFIYGLKIPWTFIKFWQFHNPERGDVVVFIKPSEPDKDFVKRVIGLPGDIVEMRGSDLIINGLLQNKDMKGEYRYKEFYEYDQQWVDVKTGLYDEHLGTMKHVVIYRSDRGDWAESAPVRFNCNVGRPGETGFELTTRCKVQDGTLLMMGDNRDNSSDSRVWGLVPLDHVKGKAMFIWWSWYSADGFRWKRLFTWIK
jgi:signal peptidase I